MGWLIRLNEVPNETSMRNSAKMWGGSGAAIDVPIKGWYQLQLYKSYIYINKILDHEISSSVFIAVSGSPPFPDT